MNTKNPYESIAGKDSSNSQVTDSSVSSGQQAYNIVSDTVTGLNVRKSDNVYQAKFIFVSIVVFALIGVILSFFFSSNENQAWIFGGIAGGFAGLVFGVIASGIVLMIYRTRRHFKGKHD